MSDEQILAIIAAIVGHGNLGTSTPAGDSRSRGQRTRRDRKKDSQGSEKVVAGQRGWGWI